MRQEQLGARWIVAMRLAVLLAVWLAPAPATLAAEGTLYPVYLRDGRTLESSRKPHSVNGKVGIYAAQRRLTWLPAGEVDLERSRSAWEAAAGQARLDTDALTGNRLFPIAFTDSTGTKRELPNSESAFTFVEIWHPY